MSRSFRKPYSAITGVRSAADDKRVARRNWRHAQNHALRQPQIDWDEFLIPARYEAAYNDVWSWGRDGKQTYHPEPTWEDEFHWFHCNYFTPETATEFALDSYFRQLDWYASLKRK